MGLPWIQSLLNNVFFVFVKTHSDSSNFIIIWRCCSCCSSSKRYICYSVLLTSSCFMSPGVLNVTEHWMFTAIFIFSITISCCLLLLGLVFFMHVILFVLKSEFPYHSRLLLLASKSSSMCFTSVLQPGRWQVLKANMKEGELLEGSKEFLLPGPRVSAVFRGMLLSQCALWNCPVFWELNRRLLRAQPVCCSLWG